MSISEIVYKSSEDPKHKAEKLLGNNRWLTDPRTNDDEASIIVKLKEKIKIQFIDIVYVNTASVEIFVRNSSAEEGTSPLMRLVEVKHLLQERECRNGTQKDGCVMFRARDNFLAAARDREWNEVKFVMKQPYARNKQMGFDLLRIVAVATPKQTVVKQEVTSPAEDQPKPSPHRLSSKKIMKGNTYAERMFLASKKNSSSSGETPNPKSRVERWLDNKSDVTSNTPSPSSVVKQLQSRSTSGESPFKRKLSTPPSGSSSGGVNDVTQEVKRPRKIRIGGGKKFPDSVKRRFGVPQDGASESLSAAELAAAGDDDHHGDEEQSGILIKSIKTFLNDVNLEDLDPTNIRVRDLRKKFESRFELEMNSDGKSIFLNIIQNYLPMLYRYQYNGISSNIRINEFSPRKSIPQLSSSVRRKSSLNLMGSSSSSSSTTAATSSGNLEARITNSDVTTVMSSSTNGDIPTTSAIDVPTSSSSVSQHQCPICQKYFASDVIEVHAAECCDFPSSNDNNDDPPAATSLLADDVIITPGAAASTSFDQSFSSIDVQLIDSFEEDTSPVDCSENSCLSKEEQEYWKAFAKKPKPYSARLNASDYEGVLLQKCPVCFMKYKVTDMEEHTTECAAKVYSGKVRQGLYLVDSKKRSSKKAAGSSSSGAGSSSGRSTDQRRHRHKNTDDDIIIID